MSDRTEKTENEPTGKLIPNHEYDGIQELDNNLPSWWLATFYGAIVFSMFYVIYYHLGDGPSIEETFRKDLAAVEMLRASGKKDGADGPDEAMLAGFVKEPERMKSGSSVYLSKCASCHGQKGEGLIGPNLVDKYWIHGKGTVSDILKVVREGVGDKGMPPWGPILSQEELQNVSAYIFSIKGTNPPNAKAPQGEAEES